MYNLRQKIKQYNIVLNDKKKKFGICNYTYKDIYI